LVIGKVSVPRGRHVEPLIRYLFGPGRHHEHTDPHIVAGWRHPAALEPPLLPSGKRDFRHLYGLLNRPHQALGARGYERPVWHCSLRAAPGDRMLSDDEWAAIARRVMAQTGLAPCGQDDSAVRWVAVRHAADHVHVVAMLARQDGTKPRLRGDWFQVRAACNAAEQRFGLRSTAPADRTAPKRPTRGEQEKAARRNLNEPPRVTLRRHVAAAAATTASQKAFFTALKDAGVLVRPRYSTRDPGQVTGYAVALPGDTSPDGTPIWYSGGKLAASLTWPKLSQRWTGPAHPMHRPDRLTWAERDKIYRHAEQAAAQATGAIRAGTADAQDAAWAAGDTLRAASAVLGNPALRRAADAFDRAASPPQARIPPPTHAGYHLRRAARLIGALAYINHDPGLMPLKLMLQLAALAETTAELHAVQHRAHQAAAARTAATHLRTAAHEKAVPTPWAERKRRETQRRLVSSSFPATANEGIRATQRTRPEQPSRPSSTRPTQPRPRGPGR
jgi:hypothetical protein